MSNTGLQDYYITDYTNKQFQADLARKDRLRFLFKSLPNHLKVLNIGCGPGVDIDFLLKAGNEVHGIDISDEALSYAKTNGIITHRIDLARTTDLPFHELSFDLIIATDILEHLFFPQKMLEEINRLLKQDGVVITSVPNHFYFRMRLRMIFGKDIILPFHKQSKQWNYFHIRFFTSGGIEELLELTGFKVVERHYGQFNDFPRGFPQSLGRKLTTYLPDLFSRHFIVKAMKSYKSIS